MPATYARIARRSALVTAVTAVIMAAVSLGVGGGSCTDVTESFITLSPVRTNADHMFQLGFAAGAGTLAAGATAEIGPGINKSNFSAFTQTNDYSYNSSTTFTTNAKVTVYQNGTIIYGTEPM